MRRPPAKDARRRVGDGGLSGREPPRRTAALLEASGIAAALIGGAALAVHGVLRATLDSDLLVLDPRVLDEERWGPFREEGISVDISRGDLLDPLAGVVRLRAVGEEAVDVIVGKRSWMEGILARRVSLELGGERIPVVEAADLVLLKLDAGGAVDRLDVQLLLVNDSDGELRRAVAERLERCSDRLRAAWSALA